MSIEFFFWFLLLIISCAGVVAQTVAASVHELQSWVSDGASPRVRWMKSWGGLIGGVAMASAAALSVFAIARADGMWAAIAALVSILLFLSAQWLARRYARKHLERLAQPVLGDAGVFLPLAESNPPATDDTREEAVEQMVDASEKAGLIESDEHEMITGVLQLDRTLTREIMVPRIDVIAVDVETSLRGALDVMIAGAHSRLPVFEESIDHVVGLLYSKDLLKQWRDGETGTAVRALMRPAYFVPESKRLDELLQELQRHKVHMAIVVDEYGGTAGIVTIEDVLEEIVGEIQDEYDTGEEPLIEQVSASEGVFNARVSIDEVNQALLLDLPNDSETLGGLVYQRLEKLPKVGDQVRVDHATITVLNMVGRRVKKVRVAKLVAPTSLGGEMAI